MSPAEEIVTVVAYVCYLLSLLGYWGYLLAQVSQRRVAVHALNEGLQPALAGAGTSTVSLGDDERAPGRGTVGGLAVGRAGRGRLPGAGLDLPQRRHCPALDQRRPPTLCHPLRHHHDAGLGHDDDLPAAVRGLDEDPQRRGRSWC